MREEQTDGEMLRRAWLCLVIKLFWLFEIYSGHVRARIFPSTFPALVRHSPAGPVISAFLILPHSLAWLVAERDLRPWSTTTFTNAPSDLRGYAGEGGEGEGGALEREIPLTMQSRRWEAK